MKPARPAYYPFNLDARRSYWSSVTCGLADIDLYIYVRLPRFFTIRVEEFLTL